MVDDAPNPSESFNLEKLKELIELMEKHGAEQWRLRRGPQVVAAAPAAPVAYAAPAPTPLAPAALAPAAPATPVSNLLEIKSPIVGTFYSSPTPDDPIFVTVGSKVTADAVVCIVEAMKVFNQITADVSGTVAEILVGNGDPVESGQVLFRIAPN
jgi:acetyl-CoA carboxylase biotin carboxyl carrier protein